MSQTTTVAPASRIASAIALPIPEPPPVTNARKPSNRKLCEAMDKTYLNNILIESLRAMNRPY
jgi:hypothetical protein